MANRKYQPGCPCCTEPQDCEWAQVNPTFGTSGISSVNAQTTSDSIHYITTTANPWSENSSRSLLWIWGTGNVQAMIDDDTFYPNNFHHPRLYFGWADSDNHFYVEFWYTMELIEIDFFTSWYAYLPHIRIVEVSGGTETTIYSMDGSYASGSYTWFPNHVSMQICYDGDAEEIEMVSHWYQSLNYDPVIILYSLTATDGVDATGKGTKTGFGSGENHLTAPWYASPNGWKTIFEASRLQDYCTSCRCDACQQGTIPTQATVAISGITAGSNCSDVSDLNASHSFVLPPPGWQDYVPTCGLTPSDPIEISCSPYFYWGSGDPVKVYPQLTIYQTGNNTVTVTLYLYAETYQLGRVLIGSASEVFTADTNGRIDCENSIDGLVISDWDQGFQDMIDVSSASLTITI